MALRIGKKNKADDWSEESLKQELAQISEDDTTAAPTVAASDDPLADLLSDPAFNTASTPAATAGIPAPAFDAPGDAAGVPAPATKARPRLSPVVLAGGLVFLIVAAGVGAYLMFFSQPAEDETPTELPTRVTRRPRPPAPPVTVPAATKPAAAKPVAGKPTAVPANKVVPPRTPVKRVTPGKAGIVATGAKTPAIAPKKPGQAPRVVPVAGVPTPVGPPPGMAGQPGKGSSRTTTVEVVRPVTVLTPALQAQLKALWKKGADAKHRGDNATARAAWLQMLKLRPGHPGVQEAINQLPK
jgi:hypothetical protein